MGVDMLSPDVLKAFASEVEKIAVLGRIVGIASRRPIAASLGLAGAGTTGYFGLKGFKKGFTESEYGSLPGQKNTTTMML